MRCGVAAGVANAICNVTIARKRDYLITLEKQISLREHPRERELRRRTTFRLPPALVLLRQQPGSSRSLDLENAVSRGANRLWRDRR